MASPIMAPGAYDAESEAIRRRLAFAEALKSPTAQGGQMVSGHYVPMNPLAGLADLLRAKWGKEESEGATKDQRALADRIRNKQSEEWAGVSGMLTGKPAQTLQPLTPNDDEGNVNPAITVGAQAPDIAAAYARALQAEDPTLRQFGMQGMAQMPQLEAQKQERIDARTFRQQEAEAARTARAEELQSKINDERTRQTERLAAQKELREMQIQAQRDNARLVSSLRQPTQAQIIQTDSGPMQLIGGKAVPITGPDGRPVQGTKTGAIADVTKQKDAQDALTLLQQAAPLVRGATGSTIGAGLDWMAGAVGAAPKGAQNIAQLKAISGMLVAKMPKMSGPQSDKDVQLYREMAGNIGDPSVPTKLKEEAMKTIAEIQARYAGIQSPELPFSGKASPQGGWGIEQVGQ